MVTIVSPVALHMMKYDVYVFVGKEQKKIETVDKDKFGMTVMNLYKMYNADKIIL